MRPEKGRKVGRFAKVWWLEAYERHGDRLVDEYKVPSQLSDGAIAELLDVDVRQLRSRPWPLKRGHLKVLAPLVRHKIEPNEFEYFLTFFSESVPPRQSRTPKARS